MTLEQMVNAYKKHTASEAYIYGFTYEGDIYYAYMQELDPRLLSFNHASSKRGGFAKVRVRARRELKRELVAMGAVKLGAEGLLDRSSKYNKGELFEKLVTETLTGESWVKDSVPFWVAGDIRLNDVEVQIKFDGAELTNEKCLNRLMAV